MAYARYNNPTNNSTINIKDNRAAAFYETASTSLLHVNSVNVIFFFFIQKHHRQRNAIAVEEF